MSTFCVFETTMNPFSPQKLLEESRLRFREEIGFLRLNFFSVKSIHGIGDGQI